MCTSPLYIKNELGRKRQVPCGECDECLTQRANDIYVRCRLEYEHCIQCGGIGFMCCLTYSPKLVPYLTYKGHKYKVFDKMAVIKFMKRLRIRMDRKYKQLYGKPAPDFKYFVASEYGTSEEGQHLPHYHLLFFFKNKISPRFFQVMFRESTYSTRDKTRYFGWILQCEPICPEKGGIHYCSKYTLKDQSFENQRQIIKQLIDDKMQLVNAVHGIKTPKFNEPLTNVEDLRNQCIRSTKAYKKDLEENIRPLRHMMQFYMLSNDLGATACVERYGLHLQACPTINFDGFVYKLPRIIKDRYERMYGYKARKFMDKSTMLNSLNQALTSLADSNQITRPEANDLSLFAKTYLYPEGGQLVIREPKDIDLFDTHPSPVRDFSDLENEFSFFYDNDFYYMKDRIESLLRIFNNEENMRFRASRARRKRTKEHEDYIRKKRNKGYIK